VVTAGLQPVVLSPEPRFGGRDGAFPPAPPEPATSPSPSLERFTADDQGELALKGVAEVVARRHLLDVVVCIID
jgi:hypothetical protein